MSHQPMGVSGIDTDIVTGRPRAPKTTEELIADASVKEMQAVQEQARLSQELPVVLPIVAQQLEKRMVELAKADPLCQSIFAMIGALRMKMEVAPKLAAKLRRRAMGPVLNNLTDEALVAREDTDQN